MDLLKTGTKRMQERQGKQHDHQGTEHIILLQLDAILTYRQNTCRYLDIIKSLPPRHESKRSESEVGAF